MSGGVRTAAEHPTRASERARERESERERGTERDNTAPRATLPRAPYAQCESLSETHTNPTRSINNTQNANTPQDRCQPCTPAQIGLCLVNARVTSLRPLQCAGFALRPGAPVNARRPLMRAAVVTPARGNAPRRGIKKERRQVGEGAGHGPLVRRP
jgi:hypothetical protein